MEKEKELAIEKIFQENFSEQKEKKSKKPSVKKIVGVEKLIVHGDAPIFGSLKKKIKAVASALMVICILIVCLVAVYFYVQYKKAVAAKGDRQGIAGQATDESEVVRAAIGKFMELPSDENPVLATVTDVEKVKNQKFFANAKNGDKVLIYAQNKKAILYRPSANKIIEISTVSNSTSGETGSSNAVPNADTQSNNAAPQDTSTSAEATQETPAVPVKVSVYNGTKTKGLAVTMASNISKIENTEVAEKTNSTGNYTKNIIVDLTGNNGETAQKIVDMIGGEVGDLPSIEKKPEADILVILGN